MIVPAELALLKLAASLEVEGHGIGDLVHNKAIQAEVLRQLQAVGKKAGFAGMEIIVGVVLADEEWTPANVSLFFPCYRWFRGAGNLAEERGERKC